MKHFTKINCHSAMNGNSLMNGQSLVNGQSLMNCHSERSEESAFCRGPRDSRFLVARAPRNDKKLRASRVESA
jgi:hypothetical protein